MAHQQRFEIDSHGRGTHDITSRVAEIVRDGPYDCGVAHVFVRHTSCSLMITENADPDVHRDLETLARRWAPDGDPAYLHDTEGADDMAAHARSLLSGVALSVPFAGHRLLLGTWQGIYLWEHRSRGQRREIVVTLLG